MHVQAKAALERGPASDLWRNTLSQIPSVFGRLIYLSALRGPNRVSMSIMACLLFSVRGPPTKLCAKVITIRFATWLSFDLEQQKADLELYLTGLIEQKAAAVDTWLRLHPYRNVVPLTASGVDKDLFLVDFGAVLETSQDRVRRRRPGSRRIAMPTTCPTTSISVGNSNTSGELSEEG